MIEDNYQVDNQLASWLQAEQWFLRILGAALLVAAILGLIFGILYNPNNETAIMAANIMITIALGTSSLWTLYTSSKLEYLEKMINSYLEQGNRATYVYAGLQIIVGLLFLLEGFSRGLLVMTILALTMLASGGFFIWRAQQIKKHQE